MNPKNPQYNLDLKLKGHGIGIVQPDYKIFSQAEKQAAPLPMTKINMKKNQKSVADIQQSQPQFGQQDEGIWELGPSSFVGMKNRSRFNRFIPIFFDLVFIFTTTLAILVLSTLSTQPDGFLKEALKTRELHPLLNLLGIQFVQLKSLFYLGAVSFIYWMSFALILSESLGTLLYRNLFKRTY